MQKANGAFSRDLVLAREHLMKKSFLGVAALSVVLGSGGAWAADDATSRCQEYAKEDGVSAEEMKDYMEQCLEDERMASAETDQPFTDRADSASGQND
jgi:nitrate reductase cytochrome c-type subunit